MIDAPTGRHTFKRDTTLRAQLLPHATHSAKMNLYLLEAILDWHIPKRKPWDVGVDGVDVLDPMAGCGSILFALTKDYQVVSAIELEPKHVTRIGANYEHMHSLDYNDGLDRRPWIGTAYWCQGNAADWSGLHPATSHPIRSIVFSPPYGDTAARNRSTEQNTFNNRNVPSWRKMRTDPGFHVDQYGREFFQIGSMPYPRHLNAMAIVYRNCAKVLDRGAPMVVVTADFWRNNKRVPYWRHTRELACAAGFEIIDWWQRDRSDSLTPWNRMRVKRGKPTINEEDVQVFRRTA